MARYHLSPKDGQPRVCSARNKCAFADENEGKGVEHYPNKAAAMEACAAKEVDKNETFKEMKKTKTPKTQEQQLLSALYANETLTVDEYETIGYGKENIDKKKSELFHKGTLEAQEEYKTLSRISDYMKLTNSKAEMLDNSLQYMRKAETLVKKIQEHASKVSKDSKKYTQTQKTLHLTEREFADQYAYYENAKREYQKVAVNLRNAVKDYDQKYMNRGTVEPAEPKIWTAEELVPPKEIVEEAEKTAVKQKPNRSSLYNNTPSELFFPDGKLDKSEGWNEIDDAPQVYYKDKKPVKSVMRKTLGNNTYINAYQGENKNDVNYEVIAIGADSNGKDLSEPYKNLRDAESAAADMENKRFENKLQFVNTKNSKGEQISESTRNTVNDIMWDRMGGINDTRDVKWYLEEEYNAGNIQSHEFDDAYEYGLSFLES